MRLTIILATFVAIYNHLNAGHKPQPPPDADAGDSV